MMEWAATPGNDGIVPPKAEPPKEEKPAPPPPPKEHGPQPGDIVHTEPLPIPAEWHAKKISMVIAYHRMADLAGKPPYQLVEISETNLYKPGRAWFTDATMHQINLNPQWATRTINFDYLQMIGGLIGLGGQVGIHMATGIP